MKNFNFFLPFFLVVILAVACTKSTEYQTCTTDADCSSEEICYSGVCLNRCQSDSDCLAGLKCVSGVCFPGDTGVAPDTSTEQVKAPVFSPQGGVFDEDIEVSIACEIAGAAIYYTLDGSEPSGDSPVYSAPIPVTGHGTQVLIRAIAMKMGYEKSAESIALYTINYFMVATPKFSPVSGEFHTDQSIQITTNTAEAEIFYTSDGTEPTQASPKYSGPLNFPISGHNGTYSLKARAYKNGLTPSETSEATYQFVAAAPVFDPLPGVLYQGTHLILAMTSSTPDAAILYTTDFSLSTPDVLYSGPFDLNIYLLEPFPIVKALAKRDGMRDSQIVSGRYDLPTGKYWHAATYNAGFPARLIHTSVVFDNKMWVIAGNNGADSLNDVWSSENGVIWTQAIDNGGFPSRVGHTSVVFDNKMWVIGGSNGSDYLNDVWSSENGVIWTQATSNGGFPGRFRHTSLVYDNKMWVIAGANGSLPYTPWNDVWSSDNGTVWTMAAYNGGFTARLGHASVVFDNKMWVIGGACSIPIYLNDVWWSENGVIWTQAAENAEFADRMFLTSLVFKDKMWVIAGLNTSGPMSDVWWFEKSGGWTRATYSGGFGKRFFLTSLVFQNRMWVIAGLSPGPMNDVWWSD